MMNNLGLRLKSAWLALLHLPPLVRETLLDQSDFRREYGFKFDSTFAFDGADTSIKRRELLEAIRSVLTGRSEVFVADTEGRNWKVFVEDKEGKRPQVLISINDQWHNLTDFIAFLPDCPARLRSFEETASEVNLPADVTASWRDIISKRELDDEEFEQLRREFHDTPVRIAYSVCIAMHEKPISVSSLVPSSRRYFARLVGEYDGSPSICEYAAGAGKNFIEGLSAWQSYKGFLSSLLLSSHSALTAEISVERLGDQEIIRAFEFLIERRDRLSQLGAVEVGLRILPEKPEIEASLVRLVEQIRDDNVDEPASGFKLLSALFTLVDGELSRTRLFSDIPPFFRRLASLAQAALIQRETVTAPIDIDSFCESVLNIRGGQFHFQSLADMRLEPRWNPGSADASRMKADFLRRLVSAGEKYKKNIVSGELRELLLGSGSGSLFHLINPLQLYFPGPLEGGEVNLNALSDELKKTIEDQLKAEEVTPLSFIALVNAALIFGVDQSHVKTAAELLRTSGHRFANIENQPQLSYVLNGLATVAAVSRETALADELRILVRQYRQDKQYALSIDEALGICLVASASRYNLKDWRDSVGDWLTELAFGNFQKTEDKTFYSHMRCLLDAVPELWVSCGRADAALRASIEK